jgi:hypothetical protein
MDPETLLRDIEDEARDGNFEEARELLADLAAWLRLGGFEPANLKGRTRYLETRYRVLRPDVRVLIRAVERASDREDFGEPNIFLPLTKPDGTIKT